MSRELTVLVLTGRLDQKLWWHLAEVFSWPFCVCLSSVLQLTVPSSTFSPPVVISRAAEEAMISDLDENNPGTEWERVARLCDFNPKSSKQAKDVSRMRSVLISLKQSPLVR